MAKATPPPSAGDRVRPLAELFAATDLVKLRVRDASGEVELRRSRRPVAPSLPEVHAAAPAAPSNGASANLDVVSADLVGIIHFARPLPAEGITFADDRELGYVEALGIRNPVRSRGPGRIVAINVREGQPVDYGQALFTIDRNA